MPRTNQEIYRHFVKYHRKGITTLQEVAGQLIHAFDPADIDSFLRVVPADILNAVERQIETMARTDEDWSRVRFLRCDGEGETNEAFQARRRTENRAQVERLRAHFASRHQSDTSSRCD